MTLKLQVQGIRNEEFDTKKGKHVEQQVFDCLEIDPNGTFPSLLTLTAPDGIKREIGAVFTYHVSGLNLFNGRFKLIGSVIKG